MATRITSVSQVPNPSSGVYFREVDLTVVTNSTGGFTAAAIGLTEKGPAFEISNSSTYEDRAFRLGELNPDFPMSYYAKQYLEQARNYKEVRLLGLEGYTDVKGYAITFSISGAAAAVPGTSPLTLGTNGLVAVLKERPTTDTGRLSITSVVLATTTFIDPITGLTATSATDYLFDLVITYSDASTDTITCSLRPESKEYIVNKLWDVPFNTGAKDEKTFPLIKNAICPLWVEFIIPSTQTKPSIDKPYGYYLPASTTAQSYLPLLTGNIIFGTSFTYQSHAVGTVTVLTSGPTVTGVRVTVTGFDITGWWSGPGVKAVTITGVVGTGNMSIVNGTWAIQNLAFSTNSTFELIDLDDALNSIITPLTDITSSSTYTSGGTVAKYGLTTWEREVLNFTNVIYQTPLTPWFVSDGDSNGDFKRLFRFWSISDGESANTEIKIEVKNLNPTGNNGNGTFDIVVRKWDDRDDLTPVTLETYSNLTMEVKNDNYILKRIGNGEDFPLRSRFIFIEMNLDEQLQDNLLPYGVLGYPNITGARFIDLQWTNAYDLSKSLTKQGLGLSSNSINTFRPVAPGQLTFKNTTGTIGKGFHLNPLNNTTFATDQAATFTFASQTIYQTSTGGTIVPQEKVRRSRFIVDFYGGFDGFNVYKSRDWGNTSSMDYQALLLGIAALSDKESLDADFTVLTSPDIHFDTHASACEAILDMVQTRGDCLYIPDMSYDDAADTNNAVDLLNGSNMRSSSTAVYFPWIQIEDTINKVNKWTPPSLLALGTITYTAMNENVWQPPGGAIRTVTNNLVRTRRRLKLDDRDILKVAQINPITLFPGSGYEITEVRTTQDVFSALSFIHNRLLLCYAKKTLNQVLRPLLFQLNGDLIKDAFISTVTPIFDRIKKLNGLEEYKVEVVDRPELNDRTTLYGRITIVPLYPVERIVIDFVLSDTGTSFNA